MMKKILIVLTAAVISLTLCGCRPSDGSSGAEEGNDNTAIYIKPLNDAEVFDLIADEGIRNDLRSALDGKITPNYVLKMLGKDKPQFSVEDYYGEEFRFPDSFFVLELVASWCEHCQAQAREYNPELMDNGISIVQYFNVDGTDGIDSYYESVGEEMDGVTVIPHDDRLTEFVGREYDPMYYPTFIVFDKGKVVYATSGHMSVFDLSRMDRVIKRELGPDDLIDKDGNSIFSHLVSFADVERQIGDEGLERLRELDNDGNSYYLTVSNIGRKIDTEDRYHFGGQYINEVDDFSALNSGNSVVFAAGPGADPEIIDEYIKKHPETECYVMLMGDEEFADHPACRMFSSRAAIPIDLAVIETASSLTAIFIIDGVTAGVYSNPIDMDSAVSLFFGEEAIVYGSR